MNKLVKIAVDAMGGDGSPKKIIDGIIKNHQSNKDNFFKIFGNEPEIKKYLNKSLDKKFYEILHTEKTVKSCDCSLFCMKQCHQL